MRAPTSVPALGQDRHLRHLGTLGLRGRLTLFAALLVLVAVCATGSAAGWLIERQAALAARARLDHATEVVASEYENILENARIAAELLAVGPVLGPLGLAGPEGLTAVLRSVLRARSGDYVAVVGPDGVTLAEVERGSTPARATPLRTDEAVTRALAGSAAEGIELTPSGVRAVVALPVRSGADTVGAVIVASNLDEALANRLQRATQFNVTFYAGERATATSLKLPVGERAGEPRAGAVAGASVWTRVIDEQQEVEEVTHNGEGRALVRYVPLRGVGGQVVGMFSISASLSELLGTRTQLLASLAVAAALVLGLAVTAGAVIAGALSRPIRRLAVAVRRIGEGDLASPVPVIARDDEVGRLTRAVEDMRERLRRHAAEQEQLKQLKDQYLFNVAHELKTPLATLIASVEELAEAEASDAANDADGSPAQLLGMVQRSTARLRALVDNLLDLGSLRAGRFAVAPRPADLREIVTDAVAAVRPLLEAKGQRVTCVSSPPLPPVLADARRAQQALVNLLSNASKYGPVGDVIQLRTEVSDGQARVAVADHGPGIPPAEQPRLFEAYFRSVTASRVAPGVGLGLAIVKAIVEAHGGRVGVESVPPDGATFWFSLPLAEQCGAGSAALVSLSSLEACDGG